MADHSGSIWLAATAFDDPERLTRSLVDLKVRDVGVATLCMMGHDGALGGMRKRVCDGSPAGDVFLPLFRDVVPVPFLIGGAPVLATADRLLTSVKTAADRDGAQRGCWLPAAQRERLTGAIAGGAVVLLANPDSRDRWQDSTKVLLQHSRHPVQSHELTHAHLAGR